MTIGRAGRHWVSMCKGVVAGDDYELRCGAPQESAHDQLGPVASLRLRQVELVIENPTAQRALSKFPYETPSTRTHCINCRTEGLRSADGDHGRCNRCCFYPVRLAALTTSESSLEYLCPVVYRTTTGDLALPTPSDDELLSLEFLSKD
jgi:hypothetical protein